MKIPSYTTFLVTVLLAQFAIFPIFVYGSVFSSKSDFIDQSNITPLALGDLEAIFSNAVKDSHIRMPDPNNEAGEGLCAVRYENLKKWLKMKHQIDSGLLGLGCPDKNIVGIDQVSGLKFSYANYHYANAVLVKSSIGSIDVFILDPQFSSSPIPMNEYLETIIQGRKIEPLQPGQTMPSNKDEPCRWMLSNN